MRGHGQEEDHGYIQALFLGEKKKKEKKDKSLIHGLLPKIIILKCICYLHSARRVAFLVLFKCLYVTDDKFYFLKRLF